MSVAQWKLVVCSPIMLRNRIFLGVAPLVVLLMVVGGYAVWLFVRLGGAVNTTLHENYTSIAAMRDLKDAAVAINQASFAYRVGSATLPQTRLRPGRASGALPTQRRYRVGHHHGAW